MEPAVLLRRGITKNHTCRLALFPNFEGGLVECSSANWGEDSHNITRVDEMIEFFGFDIIDGDGED
jgi:hypothetical protein